MPSKTRPPIAFGKSALEVVTVEYCDTYIYIEREREREGRSLSSIKQSNIIIKLSLSVI